MDRYKLRTIRINSFISYPINNFFYSLRKESILTAYNEFKFEVTAINKYSEAMKLVKVCEDKIKNAEEMVTKIVKENGTLEDFEVTE